MAERKIRSKEERVAELDKKIAYHKQCVTTLEAKKESVLNPKSRKRGSRSVNTIISKAKEAGLTNEQIAEKLGITFEEE